ncbi:hypothetical protein CWE12_00570 [Aliidiomarina sedimenti]|uniref:UPF0352 protein CWE12_00570 n=1 Tax=Aliidiomarina sedimenti TaxID=1933879 RepID=A0ABY0C176_9GAMM|nr:DUF1414 domain-containing protein [Aliidiomarina sedimenti]RUO31531.1 hypothetical protein CWE12_00570 [Aliidiomarina sedimenti]
MPIVSKYSAEQQEQLLDDVMAVFEDQQIPVDLCLMTLGNAVSNVISRGVPAARQEAMAEQFSRVLLQSVHAHKA